jgi:hypothetical protein
MRNQCVGRTFGSAQLGFEREHGDSSGLEGKSSRPSDEVRFLHSSRRNFLATLPAISIPLLTPQLALGQQAPVDLSFTPVDSLVYYRLLLETVRGDACSFAAERLTTKLEECSDALEKLRGLIEKFKPKLQAAPPQANLPRIEVHLERIESKIALIRGIKANAIDPTLFGDIPATTDTLVALLYEVSADCDPKLKEEVTGLVNEMLRVIEEQREKYESFRLGQDQWSQAVIRINKTIDSCQQDFEYVSLSVASAPPDKSAVRSGDTKENIEKARDRLRAIEEKLSSLDVGHRTAKGTLTDLLVAIDKSLEPITIVPASYDLSNPQNPATQTFREVSTIRDASVVRRVLEVVRDRRYFKPPAIPIQVTNCIAVCLPIWVGYPGEVNKLLRTQMIKAVLEDHLIYGAVMEEVDEIASKLADVFSVGSREA